VGHVPFDIAGLLSQWLLTRLVFRVVFHRLLTAETFLGRKARPNVLTLGGPLIRQKPAQLEAAGVSRVPRVIGVRGGKPLLEDHSVVDVHNVIWCTGFSPGFSWIDLPVLGDHEPDHFRGRVEREPGLYFVGLHFLYAFSSSMIHGVGRDAEYVVRDIASRQQLLPTVHVVPPGSGYSADSPTLIRPA
jgi:putative flavoprotein involved in K+ transport